jgi:hypothetical protein
MRAKNRARTRVDSEHLLLLKGLLLWVVVGTAFLGGWHYGLLSRVWLADSTGIAAGITLVFLATAAHGSWQVLQVSREINHAETIHRVITGDPGRATGLVGLPEGCISTHIRNLHIKSSIAGGRGVADQGLLLDSFEAELRQGHDFGWFIADMLLSLGLLGTVIGFIVMLAPIGGLDSADQGAIKEALAAMSGGMAAALYTTLAGLVGGMLLKLQGYLLDSAVADLVRRTTQLTEIYVLPAIERRQGHAAA